MSCVRMRGPSLPSVLASQLISLVQQGPSNGCAKACHGQMTKSLMDGALGARCRGRADTWNSPRWPPEPGTWSAIQSLHLEKELEEASDVGWLSTGVCVFDGSDLAFSCLQLLVRGAQ